MLSELRKMDLDKDGKQEYVFQGFIYNPQVDIYYAATSSKTAGQKSYLQTFIDTAQGQVGKGPEWSAENGGMDTNIQSWSGGFIRACAARSGGILGVIIPDTVSCSAIGSSGVANNMGTWLDGPYFGGLPDPQIGDIALFRTGDTPYRLKYGADKAGIVVSSSTTGADVVNGTVKYSFKVVMGDCDGVVAIKSFKNSSNQLSGLFRPDWDRVDTIAISPQKVTSLYGMYIEQSLIEDAAIRDLKYVKYSDGTLKPSIKSSGIKLCAINYTGMLANLYGVFAEMTEYQERREDQQNYIPILSQTVTDQTSPNNTTDDNTKIEGEGKVS